MVILYEFLWVFRKNVFHFTTIFIYFDTYNPRRKQDWSREDSVQDGTEPYTRCGYLYCRGLFASLCTPTRWTPTRPQPGHPGNFWSWRWANLQLHWVVWCQQFSYQFMLLTQRSIGINYLWSPNFMKVPVVLDALQDPPFVALKDADLKQLACITSFSLTLHFCWRNRKHSAALRSF